MEQFKMRQSDLAIEVVEQFIGEASGEKSGIIKDEKQIGDLLVTTIDIKKSYEKKAGKKAGRYVSIDTSGQGLETAEKLEATRRVFSETLTAFLHYKKIKKNASCLVVGLGNEHITPDALGPMTLENLMVTRHLYEIAHDEIKDTYRKVSALAPGVMGLTGIETYDIIESVTQKIKPDFLIVVDALAARAARRVNKMIQMTDTGISPGSGVGNARRTIDESSLGIPVIAIGIPTVVDAISVTYDTIDLLLRHIEKNLAKKKKPQTNEEASGDQTGHLQNETVINAQIRKEFLGKIGMLSNDEKRQLLAEVLTPTGHNLIVTPKNIDSEMADLSRLISNGLNVALHPDVSFVV